MTTLLLLFALSFCVLSLGGLANGRPPITTVDQSLTSAFTDATGTLAVTKLSVVLSPGQYYRFRCVLQVSNSTAADGVQINFNGGGATATTFFAGASIVGANVAGTVVSTSLAGVINYTTVTGTDYLIVEGFIKVNAGGTFIMQAATNTHVAGTMTLGIGSYWSVTQVANV